MRFLYQDKQNWISDSNSFFRGYIFVNDKLIRENEALNYFQAAQDDDELLALLRDVAGCFACILIKKENVYLISDITRSFPLFWKIDREGELLISDDGYLLIDKSSRLNEIAIKEMLSVGYVVGSETLLAGVHVTEGGGWIKHNMRSELKCVRYAIVEPCPDMDHDAALSLMKYSYDKAIARMITYLNGRQAVVPLSGGLDGRFIVASLVKYGYKRILAYTYGREISGEVLNSKAIAEACGVQWICVPYNNYGMRSFYRENSAKILRACGQLSACANIQDMYALHYLNVNHLIDDDAVILPGHAFSNMAELSPSELEKFDMLKKNDIADLYINSNYVFEKENLRTNLTLLRERLTNGIYGDEPYDKNTAFCALKDLNYRERQCKFIFNSRSVFDFFKYDSYAPFEDTEVFKAWNKMPKCLSDRRAIYYDLIKQEIPDIYAVCPPYGHEAEIQNENKEKNNLKLQAKSTFQRAYRLYELISYRFRNNMNLTGYFSFYDYIKYVPKGYISSDCVAINHYIKDTKKMVLKAQKAKG